MVDVAIFGEVFKARHVDFSSLRFGGSYFGLRLPNFCAWLCKHIPLAKEDVTGS